MITRSAGAVPSGCRPRDVAALVTRLFDAFNAGEWDTVDRLFAPAGSGPLDFRLFALDRDVVYDRDQLVAFLAALRLRGERFRLLALRVEVERTAPDAADVDYVFERPAGTSAGKWLVDCRSQRIWQGAMGASGPEALPCPVPPGWSPSGPIIGCTGGPNATALATNFRAAAKRMALPRRCRPSVVLHRIRSLLSAFNRGDGTAVARHFVPGSRLRPYDGITLVGSRAISAFVAARYRAGDGWTANSMRFRGSTASLRRPMYTVGLLVSYQGRRVGSGQASSVVECRSGRLERWVGPAVSQPGS